MLKIARNRMVIALLLASFFSSSAMTKADDIQASLSFILNEDETMTLVERVFETGQEYNQTVKIDRWGSRILLDTRVQFDDDKINLYKYCNNRFSKTINGEVINSLCWLSTTNEIDLYDSLKTDLYLEALTSNSKQLNKLYSSKSGLAPSEPIEKLVYWAKILHEYIEYEYSPERYWEKPDSIFDRGTGDCKAFAIMIHYLLNKDGIEAQPVAVTASINRAVNTFHAEPVMEGRNHIAIKLVDSGAILEVTDPERLGSTPMIYSATTALGILDGQARPVSTRLDIFVSILDTTVKFEHLASGADDYFYKFQKIKHFDPIINLFRDIGAYSYAGSYSQQVEVLNGSTLVTIQYTFEADDTNKNFKDEFIYLPLNRDFREQIVTGTSGYSLCYVGPDLNIVIDGLERGLEAPFLWEESNDFLNAMISINSENTLKFTLTKEKYDRRCTQSEAAHTKAILGEAYTLLYRHGLRSSLAAL